MHRRCRKTTGMLFGQTLRRWSLKPDGSPTECRDVRDACPACLTDKVRELLCAGWERSGEPYVAVPKGGS